MKDDRKFRAHISLWSGSYSNSVRRFTGIVSETVTYAVLFSRCLCVLRFSSGVPLPLLTGPANAIDTGSW